MHFTDMVASILSGTVPYGWPSVFIPVARRVILGSLFVLFVAIWKKIDFVHALAGLCTPRAQSGGGHRERYRL
jgi:hypothetical protein